MGKPGQGSMSVPVGAAELPETELFQNVLVSGCLRAFYSLPGVSVVDVEDRSESVPDLNSEEGKMRHVVSLFIFVWRKSLGELCVQDKL